MNCLGSLSISSGFTLGTNLITSYSGGTTAVTFTGGAIYISGATNYTFSSGKYFSSGVSTLTSWGGG